MQFIKRKESRGALTFIWRKKDALRSDWFHWTLPQIFSLADFSLIMRSSHTKPTEGSMLSIALSIPEYGYVYLLRSKRILITFFYNS